MHYDLFHARALGLRGATYETKFGDRRTYCVGGKMFAMAGHVGEETPIYGFKTSPMAFELLVESGLGRPMPYLQRAKWVELLHHESLDAHELMAYVAQAHALIAAKLTRAGRAELGL